MSYLKLLLTLVAASLLCSQGLAQFRSDAFSQQYNSDKSSPKDSTDVLFSFKDYWAGLQHKNELKIGTAFAGSALVIGGYQIYNKDYWKLPIVYGTIAGSVGAGVILNTKGNHQAAKYCFIGAGVAYWATLMDGVINYKPDDFPHPGKATLYSVLVPGLGQIYNKEYWKLPIYLGAMGFAIHYHADCTRNFNRFRSIYLEASDPTSGYSGPLSADQALYYKNVYRRYRDYAVVAIAALYLLQIMDANVFSYMHNFEVNDDLSLHLAPTMIVPDMQLASNSIVGGTNPAFGFKLGFTF